MLDTRIHVQTPEGIELAITPAGLLPRCLAWLTDFVIRILLGWIAWMIFVTTLKTLGVGLFSIVAFALYWLYNVLFEVFYNGQTPGKRMLGIRVIRTNGAPVKMTASVLRNLIRVVDALPLFYFIGIFSIMTTRSFSRLGDLVADTVVAYTETGTTLGTLEFDEAARLPLALKASDHLAVMLYAERLDTLTDERASELAAQLSAHIEGSPDVIRDRLCAHALWLSGDQT